MIKMTHMSFEYYSRNSSSQRTFRAVDSVCSVRVANDSQTITFVNGTLSLIITKYDQTVDLASAIRVLNTASVVMPLNTPC